MKRHGMSPQAFLEKARPLLPAFYQSALLITDSAELAEHALSSALFTEYTERRPARDRRALRENLRKSVRECAFAQLRNTSLVDIERGDWRGPSGEAIVTDATLSALYARFAMEELPLQRYMLLRYGCGLSAQRAAEAAEMDAAEARDAVARFKSRASGANSDAFDRALVKMCRMLANASGGAPDMSAVCRAFERDAVEAIRGTRRRRNLPAYVLCAIGVLICALLFWLVAILLEPSEANVVSDALVHADSDALFCAANRFCG